MTITAYTGLPGHGKSYGVVEHVIKPALENKREIFTNIPMNDAECKKRFGSTVTQFKTDDILENPKWWNEVFTPGAVIVLDELWRLWPSGLNAKNVRDEDKAFLAEHRHIVGGDGSSTEIVFVTQDLSQIANFARSLVETTFRVTKLSKVGLDKRFRVDVYFGPVTGASPPVSKREREIQGKFKPEIYKLYKSHTKSVTGKAGNETRIDKRFNALGGLSIKLGMIAIVLGIIGSYYGYKHMVTYYGGKQEKKAELKRSTPSAPVATKPVKKILRFLSKADSIYITGIFKANFPNGKSKTEYIFEVNMDESIVHLNQNELAKLGYEHSFINECMVTLKGADFEGYALCRKSTVRKGWVENLVSSNTGDQVDG